MEGCGTWLVSTGCNCVDGSKFLDELVRASVLELTTMGQKDMHVFNHAHNKVTEWLFTYLERVQCEILQDSHMHPNSQIRM